MKSREKVCVALPPSLPCGCNAKHHKTTGGCLTEFVVERGVSVYIGMRLSRRDGTLKGLKGFTGLFGDGLVGEGEPSAVGGDDAVLGFEYPDPVLAGE